ncbi:MULTISPECIES: AMP-binding protein [unclassified Frankia]|uniref:AMP-binding protein n=1 Tax=unclassified Frankia TaxID=2632575 RepID=UPI002AD2C015|nr:MULTISPECIES: AMP-binding protein [unclassified Frankia]
MLAGTLHEALDQMAAYRPDTPIAFPSEPATISLHDLAESSRSMARALTEDGVGPGSRVGIFSQNAPEFLQALFAITRTGAAACPLPLPNAARDLRGHANRLARISSVAGMRRVVVSSRFRALAGRFSEAMGETTFVCAEELRCGATSPGMLPTVAPTDLAIVQFTSGSTAAPKGVQLTHANALAGIEAISEGIELGPGDSGGIWLPLFHDMGLFATLCAIMRGIPMTVWSPTSFVKDPARWLDEFLACEATISSAPSFGYDQLTAAVSADDAARLNMRRWRIAFNGAEPIAVSSIERFLERFAPAGFAPETMFPVYGMAEATLAVTFPALGRAPVSVWVDRDRLANAASAHEVARGHSQARGIVGVGQPVRGVQVRIGDAAGTGVSADDHRVGEIEIRGDSVTSGYLEGQRARDDRQIARPAGSETDPFTSDGWLRTGDLGFRRGEELFVTGRRKEMIIVHGANFYPEDVEGIVRDIPGVFKRRCVAVAERNGDGDGDGDGAELMTLLAETSLEDPTARDLLAADLRAQVIATLGLSDLAVRLVAPSSLPRTSSGKFQRLAVREQVRHATA